MHLQADLEDTEFELGCANNSLKEVREENQQLKDRIAELEKENKDLIQVITDLEDIDAKLQNTCDICETNLKQFAERLKEELKDNVNEDNVDAFVECSKLISETLKEFINKGE